jgi:hypothetical protein
MEKQILEKIKTALKENTIKVPKNMTEKILLKIEMQGDNISITERVSSLFSFIIRPAFAVPVFAVLFIGLALFTFTKQRPVRVTFMLHNPQASSVRVAGDFNDWNPSGYRLTKVNGHWKIELNLEPRQYQYVFVVDDKNWIPDPANSERIRNDSGYINSVIDVGNEI